VKPLFTLHAGEYLVGSYIETHFRKVNLWIPSRDTGIDLLVSDRQNRHTLSLQVKFSKDFLVTHLEAAFQPYLRATGWWSLDRTKLEASPAQLWVLVLQGFASRSTDFLVIPKSALVKALTRIHGNQRRIQTYLTVTQDGRCYESRGVSKSQRLALAEGTARVPRERDFTPWLNRWTLVAALNR
jgi:hypothetical protein